MAEKVIRLFVSSSAHVAAERLRVARAAEKLNGEFAAKGDVPGHRQWMQDLAWFNSTIAGLGR